MPYKRILIYRSWDEFLAKTILGQKVALPANALTFGPFELIKVLFEWHRRRGITLLDAMKSCRLQLSDFMQLEKKLVSHIQQGLFQNVIVISMVWGMVIAFKFIIQIDFEMTFLFTLFLIQSIGLFSFLLVSIYCLKFYFTDYLNIFSSISRLNVLHLSGIPFSEMINASGINGLKVKNKALLELVTLVKEALRKHQKIGVSIDTDLDLIKSELNYFFEAQQLVFKRRLEGIKFLFLVLFQVLCYFLLLYHVCTKFIFKSF